MTLFNLLLNWCISTILKNRAKGVRTFIPAFIYFSRVAFVNVKLNCPPNTNEGKKISTYQKTVYYVQWIEKIFAEISSWAVRIANFGPLREPAKNSPFHRRPFQPYNQQKLHITSMNNLVEELLLLLEKKAYT